ncbi:MAG TPA: tRNA uracil 4-sulfurtransferase ThiI [bacterium]|nr:tRNA uracil 4-sulfurtransferase ThiI [bacterium]
MGELILARYGEIGLKGKNRRMFENRLIKRMEQSLTGLPLQNIRRTYGRIYLTMVGETEEALRRLTHVFGLVGVSPTVSAGLDLDQIKTAAVEAMKEAAVEGYTTFKVETRRPNKSFAHKSPEISREAGAEILRQVSGLTVDVHQPQVTLQIEVREQRAYLYWRQLPCPGGLPVGVSGRSVLLLSGGIDSPVAGWMAMSRGLEIVPVYFHSFPFTSDRAKEKVVDLCRVLARYSGLIKLYIIPFTNIQTALRERGREDLQTIFMRRMMMRLSQGVAEKERAEALITGESLGQVASQTVAGLAATEAVVDRPVLRPLIGLDKQYIVERARELETYEISIRPYDDCCTVFVPRHPDINPDRELVAEKEAGLVPPQLLEQALTEAEILFVTNDWEGS